MSTKEKAEELVREYYTFGLNNPAQSFSWYECKQCAIIAVNNIIKRTSSVDTMPPNCQKIDENTKEYWISVKTEIENL